MKLKLLLYSIIIPLFLFSAIPVLALTFPEPPLVLPCAYGDKTITQAIEWQASSGVFWVAYRYDQVSQPTSKGMVLKYWSGDYDYWLEPMESFSFYYKWDGTKWLYNPGYSYSLVKIAQGNDWQTKIRANHDIYYAQNSSPYSFNWNNRYGGIGTAYSDYPNSINPTLLMTANWDYGLGIKFEITSPAQDAVALNDSWLTISGTCPTDGINEIGLTNDCLGFNDIQYNIDCVDGKFSGQFFKSRSTNFIIARDKNSVSSDCVDYDNLMDEIEVSGFDAIEGAPDDWYSNLNYYPDYDIKIKSPIFDTALTLPINATSSDFVFGFNYPTAELDNLNFNIKQYDSDGNLLNESYYNKNLNTMTDTKNHSVNLIASSSQAIHYVVQLIDNGEIKRQYPFGIFISDINYSFNADNYYLFPRLVTELKKKIVFNYFFAFYDGFNTMFSATSTPVSANDLDITFKSVSDNGQYNLDMKIFSASDPTVKSFAEKIRPYVVTILWLVFAAYVIFRITHLFNDNE